MNNLISLAQNNLYAKRKDKAGKEEYKKFIELVFLVDEPEFIYTNEGSISRQRKLKRVVVTVNESQLDELILQLEKVKTIDESELH